MSGAKELWMSEVEEVEVAYAMKELSFEEAHSRLQTLGFDQEEAHNMLQESTQ